MLGTILGARNKMTNKVSCCVAKKLVLVTGLRSSVHPRLQMTWSLHNPPLPRTQPPIPPLHDGTADTSSAPRHPSSLCSTSHFTLGREAWWKEQRAGAGETLIKKKPGHVVPGPRRLRHVKIRSAPLHSERLGRAEPVQGGVLMSGLPLLLRCRAFCPRQLGEARCPRSQPEAHAHVRGSEPSPCDHLLLLFLVQGFFCAHFS